MYQERMNGIQDRLDFGLQVGCQGVHIYDGRVSIASLAKKNIMVRNQERLKLLWGNPGVKGERLRVRFANH